MSGILEKLDAFAESGTIESPISTKIALGWVNNEQPPHEYENFLQNRQDSKINEIIENRNRNALEQYYDDIEERVSGYSFTNDNIHQTSSDNISDVGIDNSATCKGYNYTLETDTFLVVDKDNGAILEFYNDDDFGIDYNTLSPTIGASEEILSICSDGLYIYIATELSGTPDKYRIYKYSNSPWSGTALVTSDQTETIIYKMIIANATYLGFINSNEDGDPQFGTFPKAGGSIAWGDGNFVDITLGVRNICSDGTKLYSTNYKELTGVHLHNCYIADPTTAYGAAIQLTDDDSNIPCDVVWDGKYVWFNHILSGEMIIGVYDPTAEVTVKFFAKIDNTNYHVLPESATLSWDGRRVWVRAMHNPTSIETQNDRLTFIQPITPLSAGFYDDSTAPFDLTNLPRYFCEGIDSASEGGSSVDPKKAQYVNGCLWVPIINSINKTDIVRIQVERLV